MVRHRDKAGPLRELIDHFIKVTRSYWPGLFHCYQVLGLPATNNELEHIFASNRYHERRATGRKTASPALVLRGSVRLVASTATRVHLFSAREIAPADIKSWKRLRAELDGRRRTRIRRRSFRRDPNAYLEKLENDLLKLTLPP